MSLFVTNGPLRSKRSVPWPRSTVKLEGQDVQDARPRHLRPVTFVVLPSLEKRVEDI